MLDAKIWVYVEPIMPMAQRVNIITDLSQDMVSSKKEDFFTSLKSEYFFSRDVVYNMDELLRIGRNLRVNLADKSFEAFDDPPVTLRGQVIRASSERNVNGDFGKINQRIEKLVDAKLFSR